MAYVSQLLALLKQAHRLATQVRARHTSCCELQIKMRLCCWPPDALSPTPDGLAALDPSKLAPGSGDGGVMLAFELASHDVGFDSITMPAGTCLKLPEELRTQATIALSVESPAGQQHALAVSVLPADVAAPKQEEQAAHMAASSAQDSGAMQQTAADGTEHLPEDAVPLPERSASGQPEGAQEPVKTEAGGGEVEQAGACIDAVLGLPAGSAQAPPGGALAPGTAAAPHALPGAAAHEGVYAAGQAQLGGVQPMQWVLTGTQLLLHELGAHPGDEVGIQKCA